MVSASKKADTFVFKQMASTSYDYIQLPQPTIQANTQPVYQKLASPNYLP
jgi:CDP-diacylglycerol pyrophosphatase